MAANVPPAAAAAGVAAAVGAAGAGAGAGAGAAAGAAGAAAVAPGAPALPNTCAEKFRLEGDVLNGDYTTLYQRYLNIGSNLTLNSHPSLPWPQWATQCRQMASESVGHGPNVLDYQKPTL